MNRTKKILVIMILLVFANIGIASVVDITVATDKSTYQLGEYVTVSITAYNPNPQPVTLTFGNPLRATYILDNVYDWASERSSQPQVMGYVTIQPNDSVTWNLTHDVPEMQRYSLGIGTHSVVGRSLAWELAGSGTSTPVQFEVIPEPATLAIFGFALPFFRYFLRREI